MTTAAPSEPASPPPAPEPARSADAARRGPPPEWLVERLVKRVGRAPAALGKLLDRLAKAPVIGPVVRLFSSVVFGLTILGLIGLYIAIGSGFSDLRAALEMTDLQFFDAWPMRILLCLLVTDLIIVTLRRIPLTLFKLGSWTVHTGILTLIAGSVWYFSCKQEGSVRIYLGQTVDSCYDVTERALYAFKINDRGDFDTRHPAITAVPGLPIYYEHLASRGNALDKQVPRALAPLDDRLKDVNVRIVGYYPFAWMRATGWRAALPGEQGAGPGISYQLSNNQESLPESWLVGSNPAGRLLEAENLPLSVEYLYHPDAERLRDLQASFDGPMGITVRIPSLKIERIYTVRPGEKIVVEGSPYTLEPMNLQQMPMASKGYEGTASTALTVGVTRREPDGSTFEFQRMSLFRYPERSPDFVMQNGQLTRKQEGVDHNIQIDFHDASKPQVWIVEEQSGAFELIVRDEKGKSHTQELKVGDTAVPLGLAMMPGLKLRVVERAADSVAEYAPFIVPNEQRPRSQMAMEVLQMSMVELQMSGGTGNSAWTKNHIYVPFSAYAAIAREGDPPGVGEKPTVVDIPGAGKVGLLLSTVKRPLPSSITLARFDPVHYPGATRAYEDYVSTLSARNHATGEERTIVAHLNNPAIDQGLYYFQSAWDGDDHAPPEKRFTVIGVANRPGIWLMTLGAILIIVGIGYAFYVKPMLLKRKKDYLARWAAR
jgi:hypothetical protein